MAFPIVAICALGLEEILQRELLELGVAGPEIQKGAVAFRGEWRDVYRANWRLRTANRVLVELGSWQAPDANALAAGARALAAGRSRGTGPLPVSRLLLPDLTLSLHATSTASALRDAQWVALKVKDGLVDGQRERYGRRSSVARENPEVPLRVRLHEDRATLLLDTSGQPLDHRGYRTETVTAPVREQLAAACVLASGWDGLGPVADPMCGSGTLLIEAAWWALGWPPGRLRKSWAFERFPGFDARAWEEVRSEPLPARNAAPEIYGNDRSAAAIRAAERNLAGAGLAAFAHLTRSDAEEWAPPQAPGLVLVNPPYGERLEESAGQWKALGDLLKQRYRGWKAVVLAGGEGRGKAIGLRPKRRLPVFNGPLEARILLFELY